MMDTLIWLANFPVRNGYAMVFVAGFSMMGLIALAFRRPAGRDRLAAVRPPAGGRMPGPPAGPTRGGLT